MPLKLIGICRLLMSSYFMIESSAFIYKHFCLLNKACGHLQVTTLHGHYITTSTSLSFLYADVRCAKNWPKEYMECIFQNRVIKYKQTCCSGLPG